MVARLGPAVATAHWLARIAILQQFDDHIVELDEANVQPLRSAPEVGHADGAGINSFLTRENLLIQQERVVDLLTLEIAIAHHLDAAKHLSVELECAIHILNGQAKVLDALEAPPK